MVLVLPDNSRDAEPTHELQDARAALCCVVGGDRMQVDGPLDDSR